MDAALFFLPVFIVALNVIILGMLLFPRLRHHFSDKKLSNYLSRVGESTHAKVLKVVDHSLTNPLDFRVVITVETKPGCKARFTGIAYKIDPPKVGDMIDVVYDPNDPTVALPVKKTTKAVEQSAARF